MFEKAKQTIAAGLAAMSLNCAPEIHRIDSPNTISAEAARLVVDIIATIPGTTCGELKSLIKDQAMLVVDLDTVGPGPSANLIDGRTHVRVEQAHLPEGKLSMSVDFSGIDGEAPTPQGDFRGRITTTCTP